jgi:acetyltransferase
MHEIFYPESIAVIGASAKPTNLARNVILNLIDYGFRGVVYAVGTKGDIVATRRVHASVLDVPDSIDLAVILTPAASVPNVLEECGRKGIRWAVIETAGFRELGPQGRRIEDDLVQVAARHGIRFVGPNCVGVINRENGLCLPFARSRPQGPPGDISIITQSGGVGMSVANQMAGEGLWLNKFISIGNALNLGAEALLEYLIADPGTRVILMYLEGIGDGRRLLELACRSPKPILAMKANLGGLGKNIAASHTASLSSDDKVVGAAFRQAGITRIQDATSLLYNLKALRLPLMAGKKIAIISRSGGHAVVAADACERMGLALAELPPEFVQEVERHFRAAVIKLTNPLDLGDIFDFDVYAQIVEQAAQLPGVDGVCLLHTSFEETERDRTRAVVKRLSTLPADCGKPIAVYVATAPEELAYLKQTAELPIFSLIVESISALRFSYERYLQAEVSGRVAAESAPEVNRDAATALIASARAEGRDLLLHEAMAVLTHYGIPVLPHSLATTEAEVWEAAASFGRPVVLKVVSEAISHKTDVGGVRLNLPDADAAAAAYRDMMGQIAEAAPAARLQGVLVQPMAAEGYDLIVGGRQDAQFGPVVLVGMGGVFVEVLNEVALRVAPIGRGEALAMIDELRAAPILKGARGRDPTDIEAVADVLTRVSQLLCDFPEIQELDINPLRAYDSRRGCQALDARIILARA